MSEIKTYHLSFKTIAIGLTIIFLIFKLADIGLPAHWSWLKILSPLLIYVAWETLWFVRAFYILIKNKLLNPKKKSAFQELMESKKPVKKTSFQQRMEEMLKNQQEKNK